MVTPFSPILPHSPPPPSPPLSPSDKGHKCAFNKSKVAVSITGYVNVTQTNHASGTGGNETKLAEVLAAKGPLSVCIDSDAWRFYSSGVLSYGARTNINHCVQLVGLDATATPPYWILKNSWAEKVRVTGVQRGGGCCGGSRLSFRCHLLTQQILLTNSLSLFLSFFFSPFSLSLYLSLCLSLFQWGEKGYIRMQMGMDICGVADVATMPLVKGSYSST
jgi:hypothetical protein